MSKASRNSSSQSHYPHEELTHEVSDVLEGLCVRRGRIDEMADGITDLSDEARGSSER